jgi:hypothetical protein
MAFEIVWMVGFVWSYFLKYPTSIYSIFLRSECNEQIVSRFDILYSFIVFFQPLSHLISQDADPIKHNILQLLLRSKRLKYPQRAAKLTNFYLYWEFVSQKLCALYTA